jgi:hypothetical protein
MTGQPYSRPGRPILRPTEVFLEDGSQYGVSRTQFRRMRKAEKRELMLEWFYQNFEDPAESTPHESAEGGYQWIWGGPYDATDELYSKFGDIANERLIDEVIQEVEKHSFQWAPVHTQEDYDPPEAPDEPPSLDVFLDERSPLYGSPEEREARARAQAAIDELRAALDNPVSIGIGHNRPPADNEPDELSELRPALPELSLELSKPEPNISLVKKWAAPLRKALIESLKWVGRKLDKGVDAAMTVGGTGAAIWFWTQYSEALHTAFNAVVDWLHHAANTVF